MMAFKAGIHKLLIRITTGKTPIRLLLQKQSDLGLPCLSRPFGQATSVQNFRTFTIYCCCVFCRVYIVAIVTFSLVGPM